MTAIIYIEMTSKVEPEKTFADEQGMMDYYLKDYDLAVVDSLYQIDLEHGKDEVQMLKSDSKTVSTFITWPDLTRFNEWLTAKKPKVEMHKGSELTDVRDFVQGTPFLISKIVYDVDEIYTIYETEFKNSYPDYDSILKPIKDNPEPIISDSFLITL